MDMPQEIEVWYMLPAIRKELSAIMKKKYSLSQRNIAKILGITEAAVSQYKSLKRGKGIHFEQEFMKELELTAKNIIEHKKPLMSEMHRISNIAKEQKVICKIHSQFDKDVPENCDLCYRGK